MISLFPIILKLLDPPALRQLLQTNTALRQRVEHVVKKISIVDGEVGDVNILINRRWPALWQMSLGQAMQLSDRTLLFSARWGHVAIVNFDSADLNQASLELLAKDFWPQLSLLNLRGTDLSSGMAALQSAPWPFLKTLVLDECDLSSSSIQYLTAASWPYLEKLSLSNNPLQTPDLKQLSQGQWPQLRKLLMRGVSDNPVFMFSFKQAIWRQQLLQFNLAECSMNAASLLQLCSFPALQDLDLSGQPLDAKCFVSLVQAGLSLRRLILQSTSIDIHGMAALTQADWPQLRSLDLACNAKTLENGAMIFLGKAKWSSLQSLSLHGNAIKADGIKLILQADLPNLSFLDCSCHGLGSNAVELLVEKHWRSLEWLELPLDTDLMDGILSNLLSNPDNIGRIDHAREDNYRVENYLDLAHGHWQCINMFSFTKPSSAPALFSLRDGPDGWPNCFEEVVCYR